MARKLNGHIKRKIKNMYKRDKKSLLKSAAAIGKAANNAKEKFTDVEESVKKYAKANPWKTMGLSLLAGVVVGQILHLRK